MRRAALGLALAATALAAAAAYQVRFIPVRIAPYYEAGEQRADRPRVNVNSGYDRQLSSARPADITAVRDAIRADPAAVTPITMMVLAIRLYDVGLRDDAVFWFHAARDRMATALAVLDPGSPEVARQDEATRAFVLRAGPTINGYALCDIDRQRRLRREALEWVGAHPYAMIFVETLPARGGDRRDALARRLRELETEAQEEAAMLARPGEAAKLAAARRESEADAKYCWK